MSQHSIPYEVLRSGDCCKGPYVCRKNQRRGRESGVARYALTVSAMGSEIVSTIFSSPREGFAAARFRSHSRRGSTTRGKAAPAATKKTTRKATMKDKRTGRLAP